MNGTPNGMGPAYVVRLRCAGGGLAYSSSRMTKADAEEYADVIEADFRNYADHEFYKFHTEHGQVRIRTERVTAVEVFRVGPPPDRKSAKETRA